MLVRLGISVPELNTSKCTSLEDNVYKRLTYSLDIADRYYRAGFTHIRLTNPLGSAFSVDEVSEVLQSPRIKALSKWIEISNYTTSFHIPYKYNFYSDSSIKAAYNYMTSLGNLCDRLGMYKTIFNMHVKCRESDYDKFFDKFFRRLPFKYSKNIVFENDDTLLNVEQTLKFAKRYKTGFVYDSLHDKINPSSKSVEDYLYDIKTCWEYNDITPVLHYSSGTDRTHGDYISIVELVDMLTIFKDIFDEVIVMIEIKDCVEGCEVFKFNTLDKLKWRDDYTFEI